MNIKKLSFLLLSSITLILASCEKEGPEGPAGRDGNANVVSSIGVATSWTYINPSWVQRFSVPAITQEIVNSGAVLVYVQSTTGSYSQLPVTVYPSSSYSTTFEVGYNVGEVAIFATDSDLTQPNQPGAATFKIVVISASNKLKNPFLDYSNYEEVAKAFDIM